MKLKDNRWLTGHGFGVHSPWAYDLIENVINEKHPYYAYEDLYPYWEQSPQNLAQYPQSRDELLFRLVNRFQPKEILEIGTGAGVSTGYLATVSSISKVITIDAPHPFAKIVEKNLEIFPNVEYISGQIIETIEHLVTNGYRPQFVHIAHTAYWREAVQALLPYMHTNSVIVVEDMGKKIKKEWWKSIIQDDQVGVTFQMKKMGLLFFDKKKTKQHYVL